jgi:ABC-type multidrug transport system fused ATPase/permease subunit
MTSVLVLFRVVGYGLLLLTLLDVVSAIIPPQFSNPGWLFQTAGSFVERSAVPLIGFVLAFYGNQEARKKRELFLLRALSWIALVIGVFYLIFLVIFFITPPGLNDNSEAQITAQLGPQIAQIQQLKAQVENATAPQIEALMKSNRGSKITDPQVFKANALQEATTVEKKLQLQVEMTKKDRRLVLIKNAVKWGLGSLVSAVLFIRIWAATAWARQGY